MHEPPTGSELERLCAQKVRQLSPERICAFCASCAERFFPGYVGWVTEERITLPSADLIREAIDACWIMQPDSQKVEELIRGIRDQDPNPLVPVFSSGLSVFGVEIDIVKVALSSVTEPATNDALLCSVYSLDFFSKYLDLRREMQRIGPDFDDPGRDLREFEADLGANEEAKTQIADVEALMTKAVDLPRFMNQSKTYGERLFKQVVEVIGQGPVAG